MAQSSSRGGILKVLGAFVVLAGVIGGVVLWLSAAQRRTDAVEGFARAPVGCDTTLDFVETGTYQLFVETSGTLESIRGDCDASTTYSSTGSTPDVALTMVDPDGNELALDRVADAVSYEVGEYRGVAAFSVEVTSTDDHVIRVESQDAETFAVAVGRDPNDGVALLRGIASAIGVIGLLLGIGLIVGGARAGRRTPASPTWSPVGPIGFVPGQMPAGPPVYGQTPGPPVYGQIPTGAPQAPPVYGQQAPYGYQPGPPPSVPAAAPYGSPVPPPGPPVPWPASAASLPPAPIPQPPPPPSQHAVPPQPSIPGEPSIPGQPVLPSAFQAAPQNPSGSPQPIDWAPAPSDDDTRPAPPN